MVEKISMDEFRNSGALWWINQQLHLFGMAIVVDLDSNGVAYNMYPVRADYRGFSEEVNDDGYKKLTKYLNDNINSLLKDFNDENI